MIDLREHNLQAYKKVEEVFQTDNKTCIVAPTGSGKSYIILKLIEDYAMQGEVIVIEPRKYIFDQLKEKMDKYNLPHDTVKFLTYSSLGKITDEKIKQFTNPKLVVVDEMHKAGAPVWGNGLQKMFGLFPDDCKYIGLSATPIRYLDGKRDMTAELFNGCIANEISLADAIIKRILPLPRYVAGLYTYDNEVNAITKKIQNSSNSEEDKKKLIEEVKLKKRNLDKSNGVSDIFKRYMIGSKGKYVAFCRNIKHLEEMKPCLRKWFDDAGIKANIYEVHCKNPEKNEQFQRFMADDGIAVCMSITMLDEGIHGIDGVILLRDTVSPNLYYQQIGRAFAVDMDSVPIIFDLVANCNTVMDCALKDDLLAAIDKREKTNGERRGDLDDRGCGTEKITKEDIEEFFVFDQVFDAVNLFREIEGRLTGSWDLYIKALKQYKEREGNCLVPQRHIEVTDDGVKVPLSNWVGSIRGAKAGKGSCLLTNDMITQLEKMDFVWDAYRYKFENNVNDVISFKKEYGRKPISAKNKKEKEKKLGNFLVRCRSQIEILPQWKIDLLRQIPDFFDKRESSFDRFYKMAMTYKNEYGHIDIKQADSINGYNIGSIYSDLKQDYIKGKVTDEQVKKLQNIGIDITIGERDKRFKETLCLAYQAAEAGVILSQKKPIYKGINFYSWFRTHKDKLNAEELIMMKRLVPMKRRKCAQSVQLIDLSNDNKYVYRSMSEASKALCDDFHILDNHKSGSSVIHNRLTGKVSKPYKGRFIFQYSDDVDDSEVDSFDSSSGEHEKSA